MNNKIKSKILRHVAGLLIFGSLLLLSAFFSINKTDVTEKYKDVISLFNQSGLDINSNYDREIFKDATTNFFNHEKKQSTQLINKLNEFVDRQFTEKELKTGSEKEYLSGEIVVSLLWKFFKFIFVFSIVEALILFLAERFAILKFYLEKRNGNRFINQIKEYFENRKLRFVKGKINFKRLTYLSFLALVKFLAYFVFFSPVYVIAYILKYNSENITFVWIILFGVFTNGVLISGINKFYNLLIAESKKGYVETARVKGLQMFAEEETKSFVSSLLKIKLNFGETILSQIYESAHLQFVSSFKEISRFVITGLIIIGMALNVQTGLFYEMLRSFLYSEYDILLFILFLIFTAVKITDIIFEIYSHKLNGKYEN